MPLFSRHDTRARRPSLRRAGRRNGVQKSSAEFAVQPLGPHWGITRRAGERPEQMSCPNMPGGHGRETPRNYHAIGRERLQRREADSHPYAIARREDGLTAILFHYGAVAPPKTQRPLPENHALIPGHAFQENAEENLGAETLRTIGPLGSCSVH